MNILGISAFYHDSAACIVQQGTIIAAAQEERFTRIKHDASFPSKAIEYCLKEAGITNADIDLVCFYEKPFLKFERLLQTYVHYAPRGIHSFLKSFPLWSKQKIWIKDFIAETLSFKGTILFPLHHEAHAASAFFPSPYDEAAIITFDGVGEWTTTSFGIGKKNSIQLRKQISFPHSLGLLYSAFTYYTGFKVNSGEYKVMGLAPYGNPVYKDVILRELIDLKDDGSFHLNMDYFNYCAGLTMTNTRFHNLFGAPPRKKESQLTQRDMDLARSIQEVTEEVMLKIVRFVHKETRHDALCLAGGVSLNCVANGKILTETPFKKLWIQPAAGDSGGALGAALVGWYQYLGNARTACTDDAQKGSYLGPSYTNTEVINYLRTQEIPFEELSETSAAGRIADLIAQEKVIGLFQGRMEFGPRALGARSIIGDARSQSMQEVMNVKIKFRESFRPFAPAVLQNHMHEYFDCSSESPYMLLVAPIRPAIRKAMTVEENQLFGLQKLHIVRSTIPAVTHVDYSARIQSVDGKHNRFFYDIIKAFYDKYGCAVIINTSFNVRGEPIVCTPEDAYRCFMRTNMDYLLIEHCLLDKRTQKPIDDSQHWKTEFTLD